MQKTELDTHLIWFRNDLRIHDNASIQQAVTNAAKVLAVFCFDTKAFEIGALGFKKTEKFRARFLIETVKNLKANLEQYNIPLFVYLAEPEHCLPKLIREHQVSKIFMQREWTHEETLSVNQVKSNLPNTVKVIETYNQFLFHPDDIPFQITSIPEVFTNFRKQCEKRCMVRPLLPETLSGFKQPKIQNTTRIPTLSELGFEPFYTHADSAFPFQGGENHAIHRLHDYFYETKKLAFYKKTRNGLLGTNYSSKFSPWLANGSLSPRYIYHEVKEFERHHIKNQSTYWLIFELIWRDYFKYISIKHGNAIFKIGGILNKSYQWNRNPEKIKNWIAGQTSEPFVNANMIELKSTGWMSNRGRQNVASYFSRTLNLDWRIGASYFESLLIDYDVHSNYGNWMYVAGVGNDPRHRTFNVKLQAEHYDPHGKYQRQWLQNKLF
ncbi:DASH family cryptochrome [Aestuariibaculum sediminum]|uniref:Cryptochrome DASH n=1 Tax=Aestuariibaculum sediminum TaxID=2770637 RepID=A0A8J6U8J8_9FLAO|nr:DASH family cryptochrome [Aestuariibaculum sediminum]MBD0831677.1 DASH family cryptochrome [Aestuariibaculum sediminum]